MQTSRARERAETPAARRRERHVWRAAAAAQSGEALSFMAIAGDIGARLARSARALARVLSARACACAGTGGAPARTRRPAILATLAFLANHSRSAFASIAR